MATAIASQKRIQNQAEQAENQAQTWYQRAELALKGEDLAKPSAAARPTKRRHRANGQLNAQSGQGGDPEKEPLALEGKIAEARTKSMSKPGPRAQAQAQLAPWVV